MSSVSKPCLKKLITPLKQINENVLAFFEAVEKYG